MKNAVTSPLDHLKISSHNGAAQSSENNDSIHAGSRSAEFTMHTALSNPLNNHAIMTNRSLLDSSSSTPTALKTIGTKGFDVSADSSFNDCTKKNLNELTNRSGRKVSYDGIGDQPTSARRLSPSNELDKISNNGGNCVIYHDENDLSFVLPKRLQKLTLSLPSTVSTVESSCQHLNQGAASSPISDHGSKTMFQQDSTSNITVGSLLSNIAGTPPVKSKRGDPFRIGSDATNTLAGRRSGYEDEMPVILSRTHQVQPMKHSSLEYGGERDCISPRSKSQKPLLMRNSTSDSDVSTKSAQSESRDTVEKSPSVISFVESILHELSESVKKSSRNNVEEQLPSKYCTPTKPRGARFVEVEVQKLQTISAGSIVKSGYNSDCSNSHVPDRSNIDNCCSNNNYNVIVRDENLALKNDNFLREKFMEAKSLNRRNETGATMHSFSLWGGGKGAPVSPKGQVSAISSNCRANMTVEKRKAVGRKTSIEMSPDRSVTRSKHVVRSPKHLSRSPKHQISKLRGPLAARGMHANTVPTPHAASSSSKRSRMSTTVERSVAGVGDGLEVDEVEDKLKKDLVDEFCSEQEDYTHENSEDDAAATTSTGEARTLSNEGYSLYSRYEDMSGKHSPVPDESYTPPGRARLSSHLRTVVGHAQTLESTPSSADSKAKALNRVGLGVCDDDRALGAAPIKVDGKSVKRQQKEAEGKDTRSSAKPAKPKQDVGDNGQNFPRIGLAGVVSRMGFETVKDVASSSDAGRRGDEEGSPAEAMLDARQCSSMDCEYCDANGYDSEVSSQLKGSSRTACHAGAIGKMGTTALEKLSKSNVDHLPSDGDSDLSSIEERLEEESTEKFKETSKSFDKEKFSNPRSGSLLGRKFQSEKVTMEKALFGIPSSPNLTSEAVSDSPTVLGPASKTRSSFGDTRKLRPGARHEEASSQSANRDPSSPHFLLSLVRHSNTAPHGQRDSINKTASPKKSRRTYDGDKEVASITSTSQETQSKSRDREKRSKFTKALEFDNIKPIKLFSQSVAVKAEVAEDNIRKEGSKAKARQYPPVLNLGAKSKVGVPATFNILGGRGVHPKDVKDSTLTSINRQGKPPARSPAVHSLESTSLRRLSGEDFMGSVSPSLHSTITEPSENIFFATPHTPVRGEAQTSRPRVGVPVRIPEIPLPLTSKEFSVSPIVSGRDPSGRTLSNASTAISEAANCSGRASPTLSELSQEDQFLDSDAESDNTGVENKVHPVCEETETDGRFSPANCNSQVTINRHNSSNLVKVLSGAPAAKGAVEAHPMRSGSISEVNECEIPGSGMGIIGSPLRWRRGQAIGEGTFGRVYKGLNERTGELLAVKQLSLAEGTKAEVVLLRKEIQVMWDLSHENIVRYLGTAQSEKYLFIILEYVPGGSIQNMLTQFGIFSESLIWRFSSQIMSGVDYLHNKGVIHRDIKGANVLVTDAGVAKLADFGCSKQLTGLCTASLEESLRAIRGSVPWMAPEVIKQSGHGRSSDIWSVGATIIEMATGKPPWPEFTNNLAALFHVATSPIPPPLPKGLSPQCCSFLSRCMVIDASARATAAELIKDPFLSQRITTAK